MLTIGQIARQFGLSRSTLLHYDTIGLLTPSGRSCSNYRLYTQDDVKRLERICVFREAGISLDSIRRIISGDENSISTILTDRFRQIADEINTLREQQRVIAELLKSAGIATCSPMGQSQWKSLFAESGIDESGMKKWHMVFEKRSPEDHRQFLATLGIPPREISGIIKWARQKERK